MAKDEGKTESGEPVVKIRDDVFTAEEARKLLGLAATVKPPVHVKTISVTYGRKFNLGDFNSVEVSATAWADVSESQDLDEAWHGMWGMLKQNVRAAALPVMKKKDTEDAEVKKFYLGLILGEPDVEAPVNDQDKKGEDDDTDQGSN